MITYRSHHGREREINHIATGRAVSLGGELLPPHQESATAMKMAVESMEMAFGGNSPSRQGAGTEISVPRTRVDDGGGYETFRGWRLIDLGFSGGRL